MTAPQPAIVLTLGGAGGERLLGLWAAAPPPGGGPLAFDAGRPADPQPNAGPVVWQAGYGSAAEAELFLAGAWQQLDAYQAVLDAAPARLQSFLDRPAGSVAYGLDGEPAGPEEELGRLLGEIRRAPAAHSFDLGEETAGRWGAAARACWEFLARLEQAVGHWAWVETQVAGTLVARTVVGWSGRMDSVVLDGLDAGQAALHRRTLALAVATRSLLLREAALVLAAAARLGGLLATPGGAILALPAALRFVERLQAEIRDHRQLLQEAKVGN